MQFLAAPLCRALAALTLLAVLAGCSAPPSTPASTSPAPPPPAWVDHLDVQGFAFLPNPAKVPAARPVVLHNHDTAPHQIVAHSANGAQLFDAPLEPGASATVTFPDAQSYHVFCNIHTTMPSVTVTAVTATAATA